jgi:anaerobic selenocysteine-containing dehydrogenase
VALSEQVVTSALVRHHKARSYHLGFGIDKQGVNATQAARARCCLRALTGNIDVPGGGLSAAMIPSGASSATRICN